MTIIKCLVACPAELGESSSLWGFVLTGLSWSYLDPYFHPLCEINSFPFKYLGIKRLCLQTWLQKRGDMENMLIPKDIKHIDTFFYYLKE